MISPEDGNPTAAVCGMNLFCSTEFLCLRQARNNPDFRSLREKEWPSSHRRSTFNVATSTIGYKQIWWRLNILDARAQRSGLLRNAAPGITPSQSFTMRKAHRL